MERSVDTWQKIFPIRAMVLTAAEDYDMWIKFSSLCRRSNLNNLARKTLLKLFQPPNSTGPVTNITTDVILSKSSNPRASYAYIKYIWSQNKNEGFDLMMQFAPSITNDSQLKSRAFEKLGMWQFSLEALDEEVIYFGGLICCFLKRFFTIFFFSLHLFSETGNSTYSQLLEISHRIRSKLVSWLAFVGSCQFRGDHSL